MTNEQDNNFEQNEPVNSSAPASEKAHAPDTGSHTPTSQTQINRSENHSLFDSIAQVTAGVGEALNAAAQTGQNVMQTAAGVGGAIGTVATQAGQAALTTAAETAQTAAKQSQEIFEKATHEAGRAASFIGDNPVLRQVLKVFRAEWLLGMVGQVDTVKAQEAVRKLQQEHPNETPNEIAHRIMSEKAIQAGGVGLVSSLLPGVALALLAIDLAATTQLQAEMIYQIAAAYGMDLQAPARRGEVMAIFGLSLGGSQAMKLGLGVLRNVPLAGMAIGAGTNTVMLYTLGFAACRFYEAKVDPMSSSAIAQAIQKDSEEYLTVALAQQSIMDQILAQTILASNPNKSWENILPELKALNVSPTSLEVMTAELKSPQPLDRLVEKLNRDFALPLLVKCYTLSQHDGTINPEEARLLETIAAKFEIDLKAVEATVKSNNSKAD
ncbi:hypothetical protein [Microcoleus sp. FACHB-68]|uniref:hypothetical protein n=1 Tax=Microcoleus sp. FACHB-68 TaxID=2692826 RepID=UPI001683FE3A|nr:hypothetical protein [Microcoleus sp. FACHB-68]MBD1940269.1 hypothetical protein [Microcoleus sp. FACHB-68]